MGEPVNDLGSVTDWTSVNAAPRIAIVIVTYNSAEVLGGCLASLAAGCDGVALVDVAVADNLSADRSVAVTEEFAATAPDLPVRVVQLHRNGGYAAGINAAVATFDLDALDAVLVLNPDIRLRPGSVAALAAALDAPGRAITVPRLVNPDGSLQPSLRRHPSVVRALAESLLGGPRAARLGAATAELITEPRTYTHAGPAVWATGAAMLVSARAARALGPWDESLLLYSEETDFALRAAGAGWHLWYTPDAVFEHLAGDAYRTSPVLHALLTVNRVRVHRRHTGPLRSLGFRGAVLLGEALRAVTGRRTARAAVVALAVPSRRLRALPT